MILAILFAPFEDINSDRIQGLIQNYLLHFDFAYVITYEVQWIKIYFIMLNFDYLSVFYRFI
jgi:hypothetical protein